MSEPIIGNVMSGRTEVFVVCQGDAIERSGPMSFSLSQIDDRGERRPFYCGAHLRQ